MNYYEALRASAEPVAITEGSSSYFEQPSESLDPRLFVEGRLQPTVREAIMTLLLNHLALGYNEASAWAHAYLAGSGVSHNWSAQREPADLDCLVSVNYVQFRQSNQEYKGWSDREIAAEINQGFRNELHPRTDNFMGTFELTFYVNVAPDIESIKPYAAYSITNDRWVVPPTSAPTQPNLEWDMAARRDHDKATEIVDRYATALERIRLATSDAARVNAETALALAVQQGSALFDDIHESRSAAFSPEGRGLYDFANYRWQAGKRSGAIPALKKLKSMASEAEKRFSTETYGMEMPDTDTLIRRSMRP
jgi:hypothetical protein